MGGYAGEGETRTFSPLAALLPERSTPEVVYLEAKFAGLTSYGLSAELLGEVLPLGRPLHATAVRFHTQAVAQRLEDELGDERCSFIATGLDAMARQLDATDPDVAVTQAIRLAVVDFNRLPPEQVPLHRQRMTLILRVPTLLANSTLHFAQWRQVVAEFAARRMDVPPHGLLPRTIAHCALGAAVAAYECWLDDPAADLAVLLDEALRELASGFAERGQLR